MARPRTSATQLARLFAAAEQPIYVVDADWTLGYFNQAAQEWLARNDDDLLGVRCRYHSRADGEPIDALAAGLCPPPEAMRGQEASGTVGPPHDCRAARFLPLAGALGSLVGVLVIVDPASEPEILQHAAEVDGGTPLHDLLRRLHQHWGRHYQIDRLLGDAPAIRRARAQVELAAATRASTVICGQPGTGRQHTAAAIHAAGQGERPLPMIALACSLLNAELVLSTIHAMVAPGSDLRPGPGSLLLNDVDQLPAEVQTELGCLWAAKPFPLRLLATSREPLGELARQGRFRPDLAALLSTIQIELPPLAERRHDIPLLAQAFLEDLNARGDKQVAGFTPETLDRLDAYGWPGNLDELARVVAEAHRRCHTPQIAPADLPQRLHLAAEAAAHPRRKEETIVLDEFLASIERELIARALRRSKGNKAKAARLLGMTRPRLYRRMLQLGLE